MTRLYETGTHPFYIGMYIHIYTHIYTHIYLYIYIYTSQKECLCIFSPPLTCTCKLRPMLETSHQNRHFFAAETLESIFMQVVIVEVREKSYAPGLFGCTMASGYTSQSSGGHSSCKPAGVGLSEC